EVEAVVGCPDGESRPVRPPLHVDPLDGPVGVPLARMARAAGVAWSPPARLFADPFGRYSGGLGDGGALGVAAQGFKGPQHRLMALHLETDFHGPSPVQRDRLLTSGVRHILHLMSRELVEARLDANAADPLDLLAADIERLIVQLRALHKDQLWHLVKLKNDALLEVHTSTPSHRSLV